MADTMTLATAEKLFDLPDPYDYADVKEAYRRLILEKHPDVRKDVDSETANREASEINTANKILSKRCKDVPATKFARQSEVRPHTTYTAAPTYSPQPTYSGYGQPEVETYEWEIPIEDVTWEELFNDVWASINESRVAAREAEGRRYSFDDWMKDAAAGAFAWSARKVARKIDNKKATAQGKNTDSKVNKGSEEDMDYMQKRAAAATPAAQNAPQQTNNGKIDYADYAKYERALRWIKRGTSRLVILIIFFALAWGTITMATTMDTLGAAMYFLLALGLAAVGFFNLVFGFITNWLREPMIDWLNQQYDNRYS